MKQLTCIIIDVNNIHEGDITSRRQKVPEMVQQDITLTD